MKKLRRFNLIAFASMIILSALVFLIFLIAVTLKGDIGHNLEQPFIIVLLIDCFVFFTWIIGIAIELTIEKYNEI